MTPEELRAIAEQAGELDGWDFSSVNVVEDSPAWQWGEVVRQHLQPQSIVLDLGTGGGEVFLDFARDIKGGYGIDHSLPRLQAAARNARRYGTRSVGFAAMNAVHPAFRRSCMDVVLASFADYDVAEVCRLLKPGGVFITQQIGDNDTANIFQAFGWGSYGTHWTARFESRGQTYHSTADTARQFESFGCHVLRYEEYDCAQFFLDVRSLVFFLKASPLPWPFDPDTYAQPLSKLLASFTSERGIQSNAHRELLVVRT